MELSKLVFFQFCGCGISGIEFQWQSVFILRCTELYKFTHSCPCYDFYWLACVYMDHTSTAQVNFVPLPKSIVLVLILFLMY